MARSDAAWVDVLPRMKDFAGPLMKDVKEASKKAGTEGGRALVDGMNAEARKSDLSPVVQELQDVERAARDAADEQAKQAKKAATEVGRAQSRIIDARNQERTAAAQLEKAEADLEKRRTTAAKRSGDLERAEEDLQQKRSSNESTADELARAEADLADKRADAAKADADVAVSSARVDTARQKQARSAEKVSDEELALRAAVRESKTANEEARAATADHARAQEDLARETGDAAQEAERAVPAWKRLWSGMDGTKGLKGRISNAMSGVRETVVKEASRIRDRGNSLLGGIGKGVKWGAAGLAAGGAAFLGGAAFGGFNRLADIEDARASLQGLGHDAESIDRIMESALASVKGTAFGMGDAASVAATITAAGIKPGEDLTRTLSLVADSATIAKRDIGDMGLIWSSVSSKGKLQGDDAMQLLESGIPIWQMVADVMGVTAAEAQELGSKGEVSFDIFRQAMEDNLGGAALESGKTVRGSFANLKAAVSRLGAGALEEFYPLIAPALKGVTAFVDGISAKATPVIQSFTKGARGLYDLIVGGDFTGALTEVFGWDEDAPIVDTILTVRDGVKGLWDLIVGGDFTGALRDVFGWEEDSAVVDMLLGLRDTAIEVGGWLRDNLIPILSGVGAFLTYLGGSAVVGAIGALGGVIGGALAAIGWIPIAIGAAVTGLTWFFTKTEVGRGIVEAAWNGIKAVVSGVATWFTDTAWPALVSGWEYLQWAVSETWPVIQGVFSAIGSFITEIWGGVVQPALQQFAGYLRDTVGPIVSRLWSEYIQPAWTAVAAATQWLWFNAISPALSALSAFITGTLAPTIVWLWQNVVSPAFTAIGNFVGWAWNTLIFPALDAFKAFLVNVLAPTALWLWHNVITPAWNGISWAVETAWAVIQVVFKVIDWTVRNVIGPAFTWFRDTIIKPVWSSVQGTLEAGWTFIRDKVFNPLKNFVQDRIAPAFTSGVGAIESAWNGLKSSAMAPVRFVVDSVINQGIIDNFNKVADAFGTSKIKRLSVPGMPAGESTGRKSVGGGRSVAFRTGGVLPGYTPGSDVHHFYSPTAGHLHLSGGESIMRPEWTRAVGGAPAVARMNANAREGRAFAGGGVLGSLWQSAKGTAGDALDKLLRGYDFVTEALGDPKGALKKVASTALGAMPGSGKVVDLAKDIPSKIIDVIAGGLSTVTDAVTGGAGVPGVATKGGGSLGRASSIASQFGLTMTSGYRRGSRTAGTGSVSYHALGRARDYAGSAANMMAFFNAMHGYKPTELLYSPAGGRQWRRWGAQANTSGVTKRMHYNHVHVAFKDGGILGEQRSWPQLQGYDGGQVIPAPVKPLVYDEGGWLKPGLSLVHNKSGVPEPVFTGRQGKSIIDMLERGGPGRTISVPITATQLSEADVDRLAAEILRRLSLHLTDVEFVDA